MAGKNGSILVLCSHSDDQILGAGGALAKYALEGARVVIVVFSYGEKGSPWLKKHVAAKIRIKESENAARFIGAANTVFLGIEEGKFAEQSVLSQNKNKIIDIIKKEKPSRIFTHATDDPHPDHHELNAFVLSLCDEIGYEGEVLSFDIWNPVKIKDRQAPRIYVDISKTFNIKLSALRCFQSQLLSLLALKWKVYYHALKHGAASKCRYAEMFYKLR
ncbi:MAG TPA: PIG-L deacetylase family protein [Candidatus Nanoarchaeia archaeon]|nr:PIG-L deacetylase family protein [Candidatus Nanoarchaeia archaeon]